MDIGCMWALPRPSFAAVPPPAIALAGRQWELAWDINMVLEVKREPTKSSLYFIEWGDLFLLQRIRRKHMALVEVQSMEAAAKLSPPPHHMEVEEGIEKAHGLPPRFPADSCTPPLFIRTSSTNTNAAHSSSSPTCFYRLHKCTDTFLSLYRASSAAAIVAVGHLRLHPFCLTPCHRPTSTLLSLFLSRTTTLPRWWMTETSPCPKPSLLMPTAKSKRAC